MRLSTVQKAIIALIIANTIWGAAAPIFKWSLESVPPFTMAVLRFGGAALIFLPFAKNHLAVKNKDFLYLIIASILGTTIHISFFFLGLQRTNSINAPIIGSSAPIFIILFAALILKDKFKKKTLIGCLVGLIGIITIVVIPGIENGLDVSIVGNLFFIISMLCGVIGAIILKKIIKSYRPITMAFWGFLIGTLGFLPMFFDEIQHVGFLPVINTQAIIGISFGILLSSALAYYLNTWALKKISVEDVGLFTYVDPIIAVIIAYPLLGEIPTIHFYLGSFLVFLGIFIAEGRLHYHPIHKLFKK